MNRRLLGSLAALAAITAATALVGCSVRPPVTGASAPAPAPVVAQPGQAPVVPASETLAAAASTGPVDLSHLKVALKKRWSGFTRPVYITSAGDGSGRLFVVEQTGRVKVIVGGALKSRPYLDLHTIVSNGSERGLLGLAFSPTFKTDGKLYVDYTDSKGNTAIVRYTTASPSSSAPSWRAPKRLLSIAQPYANHNGGCLQFGPDGYLYIGMGDGGSAGDPGNRAQNPKALLGKILRIDVSKATSTKPYAIPPSNPYYLTPSGSSRPAPEVFSLGMRNPWRFSFDGSGVLWVGDVGQNAWEEVDRVTKATTAARASKGGLNFGWHKYEGVHAYPSGALVPAASRSSSYVWPLYNYPHPSGECIIGGYVYRGAAYPAMRGTYLFADEVAGWVAGLRTTAPNGTTLSSTQERTLLTTALNPSSFGVDQAGELYLVDLGGAVYQVQGTAK